MEIESMESYLKLFANESEELKSAAEKIALSGDDFIKNLLLSLLSESKGYWGLSSHCHESAFTNLSETKEYYHASLQLIKTATTTTKEIC